MQIGLAMATVVGSIAVVSMASVTFCQSWPPGITPVRGVVANVSGDTLTVTSSSGPVKIHFGSSLKVYSKTPSDLAHVKPRSFVGVTSVKLPDGIERATEIHIFPEELRGTGEGTRLMNSDQTSFSGNSRMTNGSVSQKNNNIPLKSRMTNGTVSTRSGASTLSVQFNGGIETIVVPANVTVTALTPTKGTLRPGQSVVVLTKKLADGSLTTASIISSDGPK